MKRRQMMSYFYKFLEGETEELARTLYELENTIYANPRSMLTHSRTFIEKLMEKVMIYEKIPNNSYLTILERTQELENNGLLTDKVNNALHEVRKLGNAAAHDTRQFRYSESLLAWEHIYTIVRWFVEVYHSYEIEVPEYVDPTIKTEETYDLGEVASKFEKIEELLKQSLVNDQPKIIKEESKFNVNEKKDSEREELSTDGLTNRTAKSSDVESIGNNNELLGADVKENGAMDKERLWENLNQLHTNQSQTLTYHAINDFILENPSKFVAFLDGVFLSLSIDRMNDLADYYKTEKLSEKYFTMDNLSLGWEMILSKLNGTPEEYKAARTYCKISEEKFKRNLTAEDAHQAFDNLLDITNIWIRDKESLLNQNIEAQAESAATIEET